MTNVLSNILTLLLLPILFLQGLWSRRHIPRLPEASGPTTGRASGQGRPIALIVLGESTAAGVGAATHETALTGQTAQALAQQTGRPVHWRAIGRNGATAQMVYQAVASQLAGRRADVALIALGVNDTIRMHSPARWTSDLRRVIEAVRHQVGPIPIVLAGIPPLERFPALPQPLRAVLGLRARALDLAAAALANTLSQVSHWPTQVRDTNDFAPDGFHPGPVGYAAWGDELAQVMVGLLGV